MRAVGVVDHEVRLQLAGSAGAAHQVAVHGDVALLELVLGAVAGEPVEAERQRLGRRVVAHLAKVLGVRAAVCDAGLAAECVVAVAVRGHLAAAHLACARDGEEGDEEPEAEDPARVIDGDDLRVVVPARLGVEDGGGGGRGHALEECGLLLG